jgi:hypothetical protein
VADIRQVDILDLLGQPIRAGDVVAAAFRENNVAVLRIGEVTDIDIDYEPNVVRQKDTKKVPVIWVKWDTSTNDYLPLRPTKIAARKALKTND